MSKDKKGKKTTHSLERVSVSRLLTLLSCPRKYYWTYIRKLTTKELYLPFFVGGLFHEFLEWYYKGKEKLRAIENMLETRIEEIENSTFIRPDSVAMFESQRAMLTGMVKAYYALHKKDRRKWNVIASEQPFAIPIGDLGVELLGVIDLVFERRMKGKPNTIWVGEHKTASQITKDYVDRLPFDMQIQVYPRMIKECLGLRVSGVCYNVVRKSRIRQKKDERFWQFIDRFEEVYRSDPSGHFYRRFIGYSSLDASNTWKDLYAITQMLQSYYAFHSQKELEEPSTWHRNSQSCFSYNSRCPFYRLCRYGDEDRYLSTFRSRDYEIDEKTIIRPETKNKEKRSPKKSSSRNT